MKKLVIILAITIMLFVTLKQRTEPSPTATEGSPLNAAMEQREELPETHTEQVEQITEATSEPFPTESEVAPKAEPAVQKAPVKECTEEAEDSNVAESQETVQCADKGDQNLTEYKPQDSSQPNPFENASPAEIVDHPVEDLIGEGEDHPGEGKHF